MRSNRLAGREFDAIRERSDRYLALADRLDANGRLPGVSAASTAHALGLAASLTAADVPDLIAEVQRLADELIVFTLALIGLCAGSAALFAGIYWITEKAREAIARRLGVDPDTGEENHG